ncbi:unnamed protein product, partial [Allacma fusca]
EIESVNLNCDQFNRRLFSKCLKKETC